MDSTALVHDWGVVPTVPHLPLPLSAIPPPPPVLLHCLVNRRGPGLSLTRPLHQHGPSVPRRNATENQPNHIICRHRGTRSTECSGRTARRRVQAVHMPRHITGAGYETCCRPHRLALKRPGMRPAQIKGPLPDHSQILWTFSYVASKQASSQGPLLLRHSSSGGGGGRHSCR